MMGDGEAELTAVVRFRVGEETWRRLAACAAEDKRPVGQFARVLFEDALERWEAKKRMSQEQRSSKAQANRSDAAGNVEPEAGVGLSGGEPPPPEFYEVMARFCRCCTTCSEAPCDGVCAGGMCDERCRCDDEPDHDPWEEES